ncbi:MAG: hypothetical protein V8R55_02150 [Dysosmobacter sp.]
MTDDVTYVAQWTANSDTKYTVEYYYQQMDGTYPTDADATAEREGTTDTTASLTDADKVPGSYGVEGKSYALDRVVDNQTIAGDGSTVLKVYFKLQFTVTYQPGTKGTFDEESTAAWITALRRLRHPMRPRTTHPATPSPVGVPSGPTR